YDLEVGGKHLSSGQLEAPAEVEGLKSTIVPIPVPVKFSQLFSSAMDFIQKRTTQYRVKGEAKFGLITIPFDNAGDLKLNE
ncbi:MAG: LEA type 2 family protein, partial [Bdellovibrionota bacterium]